MAKKARENIKPQLQETSTKFSVQDRKLRGSSTSLHPTPTCKISPHRIPSVISNLLQSPIQPKATSSQVYNARLEVPGVRLSSFAPAESQGTGSDVKNQSTGLVSKDSSQQEDVRALKSKHLTTSDQPTSKCLLTLVIAAIGLLIRFQRSSQDFPQTSCVGTFNS